MDNRNKPIASDKLYWLFNELEGYYVWGNRELAMELLKWNLVEEKNQKDEGLSYSFLKWSFTVSYLELINALQWFSAGILLHRKAYLPSQIMQMYYYSIFFSSGSFLAAHGKGHYKVKEEFENYPNTNPVRKEMWFENQEPPYLCLKDMGKGGEHKIRAHWFYETCKYWDKKDNHKPVLLFEDDRKYHTNSRNDSTYSLFEMAEELRYPAHYNPDGPTTDMLIELWKGNNELVDYFPDEFWVLEHLKVPLELHARLLKNYKGKTPFTQAQIYITEVLLFRHKITGLRPLLSEILKPFIEHMKIDTR